MKPITYTESDNVFIEDDLDTYIKETFTPVTANYLKRAIRTMDLFGYGDYALDVYNFINISKVNMDPDEEKLFFINLIVSHLITLIENIGLVVDNSITEGDMSHYLEFFTEVIEALYMIRDMTNIDAIYFSDIINNDYFTDLEIILLILQYYRLNIKSDLFLTLITNYKDSFLNIVKEKVNDLASSGIEESDIEVEPEDLLEIANIIKFISEYNKKSLISAIMLASNIDFKYLIRNNDFLSSNINSLVNEILEYMDPKNPNAYYMFVKEDKHMYEMLFDLFLYKLIDYTINYNLEEDNLINTTYTSIRELFYEKDVKNISGLIDALDKVKSDIEALFSNKEFKDNFLNFIKGKENG